MNDPEEDTEYVEDAERDAVLCRKAQLATRRVLKCVPDEVLIEALGLPLVTSDGRRCFCGNLVRAAFAAIRAVAAQQVDVLDVPLGSDGMCATIFGGYPHDWYTVYCAVNDFRQPAVELELARRFDQLVQDA